MLARSIELVAVSDGEIVRIFDVEVDGEAATIDTIAVHPNAHRVGHADGLLSAALDLLAPTVTTLDAWTREDAAANAWYLAADFREAYHYLHVYVGEGKSGFPGPDGLSFLITAFMHAPIEWETELRARCRRVFVCRRYVRELQLRYDGNPATNVSP